MTGRSKVHRGVVGDWVYCTCILLLFRMAMVLFAPRSKLCSADTLSCNCALSSQLGASTSSTPSKLQGVYIDLPEAQACQRARQIIYSADLPIVGEEKKNDEKKN